MPGMFAGVSIALRSMMAQQAAITVTANNVSNVNTPGYSRQRAELVEADAVFDGRHMVGTGVELQQITSLRDRILELRIQDEREHQGSLEAYVGALRDIETMFASSSEDLGDSLNKFFNSLSDLSVNAASVPLREAVLIAAENLSSKFRSAAQTLQLRQQSLDLQIEQATQEVNALTSDIAKLNGMIATQTSEPDQLGTLVDRRNVLLEELSALIGNQVIMADDGLTITTNAGTALVVGDKPYAIDMSRLADGSPRIASQETDITAQMGSGRLQGLFTARMNTIPELLADLDTLAAGFANAVNSVHRAGFDLEGGQGTDFFVPPAANVTGYAAALRVNINDASRLAASADAAAGGNGNLGQLLQLQNSAVINGEKLTDFYARIPFRLGSRLSNAESELQISQRVAQQLEEQRGAISSVSLDEEAANLIRYQRAYEAAARVLAVISELTDISVNLGRN